MIHSIGQGLMLGGVLAVMLGPVFFGLLQTGLNEGFKPGAFMALGVFLSDGMYAIITYLGIAFFTKNTVLEASLGYIGGIIMLVFGATMLWRPTQARSTENQTAGNGYFKKVLKGFMLNGINPFVLFFWIGIAGMVTMKAQYKNTVAPLFYGTVLVTVLATDLTKIFLAKKLSRIVTRKFILNMNRVAGIALIAYGLHLLYHTWMNVEAGLF